MFYSQNGEDIVLDRMFSGSAIGFFIEVGCIDGKRFSNTLHFEELGWQGICIEAHADYIELLKRNRPGSTVLHCAAGGTDQAGAIFYATPRGSLSTLDETQEDQWHREYADFFDGFVKQSVEIKTLDTILEENSVRKMDILSIDVEGTELDVLEGLDCFRHRPRVIVIEASNQALEESLKRHLIERQYAYLLELSSNLFFVPVEDLETFSGRLGHAVLQQELVHTPHPLDDREPATRELRMELRPYFTGDPAGRLWYLVRSVIRKLRRGAPSPVVPELSCEVIGRSISATE